MAGLSNRNSRRSTNRFDDRDYLDNNSYESTKYSRRRIERSSYSHSSSPSRRRRRRSSSDDRYRYSNKSHYRSKKYFNECGVVLLFLPINTTKNDIYDLFANYQTACKDMEFKKNKDEITMHVFANLGSLNICKQFLSRTLTNVVTIAKCRIKVISEDNFHSQIYMGYHLYDTPELPSTLYSDSLAKNLIENPPCNVLIFKSLDYSATEEQVRESVTNLTSDTLYDVRVIKDKSTGLSRGFCFVEMGNIADATKLLNIILHKTPFYSICSRRILAGFARMNTYNSNGISSLLPTTVDTFAIDKCAHASRVANNAIAAAQINHPSNICSIDPSITLNTQSGYCYDSNVGYYYDPNSGYYYDPKSLTYLYYDQHSSQWVTVASINNNTTVLPDSNNDNSQLDTKTYNDPQKVINAQSTLATNSNDPKYIAKEMEKWAKKQNINKKIKQSNDKIVHAFKSRSAFQQVDLSMKDQNFGSDPFILWDRLLCLLCVRKFKSQTVLEKHIQFSQLHKDNLVLFNARTIVSLGENSKNIE